MVYRGHVRHGKIELEADVRLPDGAVVTVEVQGNGSEAEAPGEQTEPLGKTLMRHAGTADGLPADAARNLDHYLYGTPKR